jgi:hypothetical protein
MSIEIISDTESNPADASTNDAAADTVETVRILGTSTCASLSGKSTLTYTIGMDTEGQSQIALLCNDGRGYLNTDAIAFKDIQAELAKQPKEITSGSLRCLYPNKSNNSPGFLLAVLKAVGLVQVSTTNPRCYEALDPAVFLAGVKVLLESAPALAATADAPVGRKKLTLKGKSKKAA